MPILLRHNENSYIVDLQNDKTHLENQLREKENEIDNLAAYLTVLTVDIENYLSGKIDQEQLKNTKIFVDERIRKIHVTTFNELLYQIEEVREALRASQKQYGK